VITGDDYLEAMGEERTELPEMQLRFMNANRVPTTYEEDPAARERSNKFYEKLGLQNGL
jgi:hypothetical protein